MLLDPVDALLGEPRRNDNHAVIVTNDHVSGSHQHAGALDVHVLFGRLSPRSATVGRAVLCVDDQGVVFFLENAQVSDRTVCDEPFRTVHLELQQLHIATNRGVSTVHEVRDQHVACATAGHRPVLRRFLALACLKVDVRPRRQKAKGSCACGEPATGCVGAHAFHVR